MASKHNPSASHICDNALYKRDQDRVFFLRKLFQLKQGRRKWSTTSSSLSRSWVLSYKERRGRLKEKQARPRELRTWLHTRESGMLLGMVEVRKGGRDAWWWHTSREEGGLWGGATRLQIKREMKLQAARRSCWSEEDPDGDGGSDRREKRELKVAQAVVMAAWERGRWQGFQKETVALSLVVLNTSRNCASVPGLQ